MRKIISLVLVFTYLTTTLAYSLATQPATNVQATRDAVLTLAQNKFLDKRGPGIDALDIYGADYKGPFIGDQFINNGGLDLRKVGVDFNIPQGNNETPSDWDRNPVYKETDLVKAFLSFRDYIGIPADKVDIKKGYFPIRVGELPVDVIVKDKEGRYTMIIHEDFIEKWNQILEKDVRSKFNFGNSANPDIRTVSLAWALFYRVARHVMADLNKEKGPAHLGYDRSVIREFDENDANQAGGKFGIVNEAMWCWFVTVNYGNPTRCDNNIFRERLEKHILDPESEYAAELRLFAEFPSLTADDNNKQLAIAFACAVNYQAFRNGINLTEKPIKQDIAEEKKYVTGLAAKEYQEVYKGSGKNPRDMFTADAFFDALESVTNFCITWILEPLGNLVARGLDRFSDFVNWALKMSSEQPKRFWTGVAVSIVVPVTLVISSFYYFSQLRNKEFVGSKSGKELTALIVSAEANGDAVTLGGIADEVYARRGRMRGNIKTGIDQNLGHAANKTKDRFPLAARLEAYDGLSAGVGTLIENRLSKDPDTRVGVIPPIDWQDVLNKAETQAIQTGNEGLLAFRLEELARELGYERGIHHEIGGDFERFKKIVPILFRKEMGKALDMGQAELERFKKEELSPEEQALSTKTAAMRARVDAKLYGTVEKYRETRDHRDALNRLHSKLRIAADTARTVDSEFQKVISCRRSQQTYHIMAMTMPDEVYDHTEETKDSNGNVTSRRDVYRTNEVKVATEAMAAAEGAAAYRAAQNANEAAKRLKSELETALADEQLMKEGLAGELSAPALSSLDKGSGFLGTFLVSRLAGNLFPLLGASDSEQRAKECLQVFAPILTNVVNVTDTVRSRHAAKSDWIETAITADLTAQVKSAAPEPIHSPGRLEVPLDTSSAAWKATLLKAQYTPDGKLLLEAETPEPVQAPKPSNDGSQPRKSDGTFSHKPGRSPEDALMIIEESPELARLLVQQGFFTLRDYRDAYNKVKDKLGLADLPDYENDSQSRRDLEALRDKGILTIKVATGKPSEYGLTPAREAAMAEKFPTVISKYILQLWTENTPEKMRALTPGELQEIWNTVNLFHGSTIHIYMPETIKLTGAMDAAIKALQHRGVGLTITTYRPYRGTDHVKGLFRKIDDTREARDAKRIILADTEMCSALSAHFQDAGNKEDTKYLKDTRLLNLKLNIRDDLPEDRMTIMQAQLLRRTILARLVDNTATNLPVKQQLEKSLDGAFDEDINVQDYIQGLIETEMTEATPENIVKRIRPFLAETWALNLLKNLDFELRVMKQFWTYA